MCADADANANVAGIDKSVHLHPSLSERTGTLEEVADGSRTDMPPAKM